MGPMSIARDKPRSHASWRYCESIRADCWRRTYWRKSRVRRDWQAHWTVCATCAPRARSALSALFLRDAGSSYFFVEFVRAQTAGKLYGVVSAYVAMAGDHS